MILFFELSKAFDTVDHGFMQDKLSCLGIRCNALDRILPCLQKRGMRVRVNEKMSDLYPVSMGVAQCSVLGPLILLLFINDLPNFAVDGIVLNFADDTYTAVSAPSMSMLDGKTRQLTSELIKMVILVIN